MRRSASGFRYGSSPGRPASGSWASRHCSDTRILAPAGRSSVVLPPSGAHARKSSSPRPQPVVRRAFHRVELHHAVAVLVAERASPRLAPRVAGRLEPQRRAERLIVEVARQGAVGVRRVAVVPDQPRGRHAHALQADNLLLQAEEALHRLMVLLVPPIPVGLSLLVVLVIQDLLELLLLIRGDDALFLSLSEGFPSGWRRRTV